MMMKNEDAGQLTLQSLERGNLDEISPELEAYLNHSNMPPEIVAEAIA